MSTTTYKIEQLIKQYNNKHESKRATLTKELNEKMNYFIKFFNTNKDALVDSLGAWKLLKQFKFDNPDSGLDPSKIYSNYGIYKFVDTGGTLYCIINHPTECAVTLNNKFIYVVPTFKKYDVDGIINFNVVIRTKETVDTTNTMGSVEDFSNCYTLDEIKAIIESFDKLIEYVKKRKFYYNFKSVRDLLNRNMKEIEPYLT